jgi:hypothetical protein
MKRRSFITSSTAMAVGGIFSAQTMAQATHNKKTNTIETDIMVILVSLEDENET